MSGCWFLSKNYKGHPRVSQENLHTGYPMMLRAYPGFANRDTALRPRGERADVFRRPVPTAYCQLVQLNTLRRQTLQNAADCCIQTGGARCKTTLQVLLHISTFYFRKLDMQTLLYVKWITSKDLLCSTGNSAQWDAAACTAEGTHTRSAESPAVHPEPSQHCQSAVVSGLVLSHF